MSRVEPGPGSPTNGTPFSKRSSDSRHSPARSLQPSCPGASIPARSVAHNYLRMYIGTALRIFRGRESTPRCLDLFSQGPAAMCSQPTHSLGMFLMNPSCWVCAPDARSSSMAC